MKMIIIRTFTKLQIDTVDILPHKFNDDNNTLLNENIYCSPSGETILGLRGIKMSATPSEPLLPDLSCLKHQLAS